MIYILFTDALWFDPMKEPFGLGVLRGRSFFRVLFLGYDWEASKPVDEIQAIHDTLLKKEARFFYIYSLIKLKAYLYIFVVKPG